MTKDQMRREQENEHVLEKMRRGENLCHTGLQAYRWAPRAIIKKDEQEMARLYGPKTAGNSGTPSAEKKGLTLVNGQ